MTSRGLRVAWSNDLGGLPVDPRVTQALEPGRDVLAGLGIEVVDATPDLSDADEVFRVSRAYNFELTHGHLLDTRRGELKDTVVWNIEEGRKLTGPQVGRAEVKRTELYHRMRKFMEQYAFLAAPVVQVPPFDVDQPWVDEINGEKLTTYLDWMKSCYYISATGLPAISVPCGFTPEGLPVGLQIVGRHQDELRRAAARLRVPAAHAAVEAAPAAGGLILNDDRKGATTRRWRKGNGGLPARASGPGFFATLRLRASVTKL